MIWHLLAYCLVFPERDGPGSPSVESAEIDFARGTLKIEVKRESTRSIYPESCSFNGRKVDGFTLPVAELERGGELFFPLKDR